MWRNRLTLHADENGDNMSQAMEKLKEAKYFLELMKENESDEDRFKYNLSACMSAFRSTIYFMGKEHQGTPGFDDWRKGKVANMSKGMQSFNSRREMFIHSHYPGLSKSVIVNVPQLAVLVRVARDIAAGRYADARTASEPMEAVSTEYRWHFINPKNGRRDGIDITTQAGTYIDELETWIVECEEKFAQ